MRNIEMKEAYDHAKNWNVAGYYVIDFIWLSEEGYTCNYSEINTTDTMFSLKQSVSFRLTVPYKKIRWIHLMPRKDDEEFIPACLMKFLATCEKENYGIVIITDYIVSEIIKQIDEILVRSDKLYCKLANVVTSNDVFVLRDFVSYNSVRRYYL
jgi:hypothetical protein